VVKRGAAEVRKVALDDEVLISKRSAPRCVLAGEGGYFAAIAADSHRTPPPAASARIVVEEEATVHIGAKPETRASSLGDNFRSRSSHRGEQPIKTSLARHEFDFPEAVLPDKFIMPLGDAKDFVYGLDPFSGGSLLSEHGREHFAQGGAKPAGLREESLSGLGVGLWQV
jgi:hypothetical protein